MSKSRKYIEEFDRNAGKPADFDNLFAFKGEKLIAKRKIRAERGQKKRAVFMSVSAAAIILSAIFGLTYLSELSRSNEINRITELAEGTNVPTIEERDMISDKEDMYKLSELVSRFDYFIQSKEPQIEEYTEEYTFADTESVYLHADIVVDARVVYKSADDDGRINYVIYPISYYYDQTLRYDSAIDVLRSSELITVTDGRTERPNIRYEELQAGSEYILAVDIAPDTDGGFVLTNPCSFPIRSTEYGWLVSEECGKLADGAVPVVNDIGNSYMQDNIGFVSDNMTDRVEELLGSGTKDYYHAAGLSEEEMATSTMIHNLFDFESSGLEFESVNHLVREDGTYDKTVLVLDNRKYFELCPSLLGGAHVIFAGENVFGEKTVALFHDLNGSRPQLVVFIGMEEITVSVGDEVNGNMIGRCSEAPVYCRFIDITGPMEVDLYE